jgi:hypothetical protein
VRQRQVAEVRAAKEAVEVLGANLSALDFTYRWVLLWDRTGRQHADVGDMRCAIAASRHVSGGLLRDGTWRMQPHSCCRIASS